jgi:hypothetical protein
MRGTHRVAVDPLGSYLLPLAALQGLVDAYNQRSSFGHEGFHQEL